MHGKVFTLFILTAGILGSIFGTGLITAAAQGEKPVKDDSCLSCHAGLYMLHDTGKWYCMCGTQACCSDCHGGVVGAYDYESAHEGLIAHPLRESSAVCQQCHGMDTVSYVNKFIAMGVIQPTPIALPPYEPRQAAAEIGMTGALIEAQPVEPWRQIGLVVVVISLVGLSFFAVRCCIEDRAAR
jgi:hypothetical protein